MNPPTKSPHVKLTANIERIEVPDKYTVRFVTKKPLAPMLFFFTQAHISTVMPKEVAERGNLKTDQIVGMGPFLMSSEEPGVRVVFKKNPAFWREGFPHLDGVEVLYIKDEAAALAAFRAKQVDIMDEGLNFPLLQQVLRAMPDAVAHKELTPNIVSLHVGQTTIPPLKDYRVRKAISLAFDRQEIVDKVFFGQAMVSGFPGPSYRPYARPQEETERLYGKQDLAQAKKLLAEAGYPNGFKVEMRTAPFGQKHVDVGQLLASQLGELGLEIDFKPITERATYNRYREARQMQLAEGTTKTSFEVDFLLTANFASTSPENYLGVNDPKIDDLLEQQRREMDGEKRKQLVRQLDDYLYNNGLYMIPILQEFEFSVMQGYVRNYARHRANGQGYSMYQVWLDK